MSVVEVTSNSDLDAELEKHDTVVVEFGAEWCGPCKQFRPHFDKFSQSSPAGAVYVDIDLDPEFVKTYGIQSVPQVMLFKNGKYKRHLTSRTAIALLGELKA